MATRTKTIEFASVVDIATLAAAANRDKSIPIYIPESGITFRSCVLQVFCRGDNTAAGSLTAPSVGVSYNVSTWDSQTQFTPVPNSGESQTFFFQRDLTSYFTTNWTGTSMTWGARFNGGTIATNNHSFKFIITYDYDDTSATQIKTIRIPIESTRQYLGTGGWQTLGGATAIPDVEGSYLPEASVTLRTAFLELWGVEGPGSTTTDWTGSFRVNGGTQRDFWRSEQWASGNSLAVHATYRIDDIEDLSAARSLEISSTLASTGGRIGGWLVCTYEFNPSTSSTIYNSVLVGAMDTSLASLTATSGDLEAYRSELWIQEPTTLTLKESAIFAFVESAAPAGANFSIGAGAQSVTTRSVAGSASFDLMTHSLVHRIDSGGENGVNFATIARGKNTLETRMYAGTASIFFGLSAFAVVNYTSAKDGDGVGAHNHTIMGGIVPSTNASAASLQVSVTPATIAETNYFLSGEPVVCIRYFPVNSNATHYFSFEIESQNEGWMKNIWAAVNENNEAHQREIWLPINMRNWKRWPSDPYADHEEDIETSRTFEFTSLIQNTLWTASTWVTYHGITFTVSGTVSGYGGAGTGIAVDAFSASDDHWLGTANTTTGGAYSITVFEGQDAYAVAREDDTHVGRSANGTPT